MLTKAFLFLLATLFLHGQPEIPKFDVASVRLHDFQATDLEPLRCSNGRLVVLGEPLYSIVPWAYDLNQNQIRDLRDKLPKDGQAANLFYDIQGVSEHPMTISECKTAMQALLADRFKLAVHWELKQTQVYDLVVAKGGPKMKKASDSDKAVGVTIIRNGAKVNLSVGPVPTGWTMRELADFLTILAMRQTVTDKTGLEGKYKFDLRFSTQLSPDKPGFEDPDIETALQKQLGLKLEAHAGTAKTLLIDHVEPPSGN